MTSFEYGFCVGAIIAGTSASLIAAYVFYKAKNTIGDYERMLKSATSASNSEIAVYRNTLLRIRTINDSLFKERDLLREVVSRYGDKNRMSFAAKPELQKVIDDAITFYTPVVGQSVFENLPKPILSGNDLIKIRREQRDDC